MKYQSAMWAGISQKARKLLGAMASMPSELFSAFDFYPSTKNQTSSASSLQSIFLVACLFVGFVYFPLFTGKTLLFGDNYSLMVPGKLFTAHWIKEGIFPLWNPTIFAGIPWIGDINQSLLYPTTLFFVLFSPAVALNFTILLHLIGTFIGMTLLARRLRISIWASYLAAILWTFCPQITGSINNISTLQSMTWMPWIVYFGVAVYKSPRRNVFWFSIMVLAQFLGGYPQHVIYSIVTAVLLSVRELWIDMPTLMSSLSNKLRLSSAGIILKQATILRNWLFFWALAAVSVISLSAVAWIPFIPALQNSTRTIQTQDQAAAGSLYLPELLKFLHPYIFEHANAGMKWGPSWSNQPNLMLFITWFGVFSIAQTLWQKKYTKHDFLLFGVILLSLLIALGDSLPTFELLQKIPLFKSSRGMSTILIIPALLLPLLIGFGVDRYSLPKWTMWLQRGLLVGMGILASLLGLIWFNFEKIWGGLDSLLHSKLSLSTFHTLERDYAIAEILVLTLLVLTTSLFLSLIFLRRKKYSLLLFILCIEMAFATRSHLFFAPLSVYDWQATQLEEITQNANEISTLDFSQYRILTRNYNSPYTDFGSYWDALSVRAPFSNSYVDEQELSELTHLRRMRDGITPNWNMVANIPIINGFTTLLPKNMHDDFGNSGELDEKSYFTQNNISVGRVEGETSINNLPQIQLNNPELAKWSVKYYLVDTWFPDFNEPMPELVLAESQTLKLYELPSILPRIRTNSGEVVTVTNFYENPNKLSFTVEVPDDSGLVIADRFDSDWKATGDAGEVVQIFEDAGLRVLELPAGTHSITLQYYPAFFYLGMGVSLCSLGILLFFYLNLKKSQ